jgi:uncharacterized protein involved in exopolysaccharide biosynthesis
MDKHELDIFELFKVLIKNRRFIILLVLIVSIAAVVYSLLTPKIWKSEASFFAVGSSSSSLPLDLGGLSSIAGGLIGMDTETDAINFTTIMESRSFQEEVIRKFDLIKYFKQNNKDPLVNMDKALQKMAKTVFIGLGSKTSLITIAAETKDKKLSKDIVEFYLSRLDQYNREQKITKGKRNREFLEERVKELKLNMDSLLVLNRKFQEKNKAVDLESQAVAMINAYSDVFSEKMKADIELEIARLNYDNNSPILQDIVKKRDALTKQITNLETDKSGLKPDYIIDISKIPSMEVQYAQIKLNIEIAQKVLEYIYPQFEAARLEELRDMPTIEIVDYPRESGIRTKPKRAIICIVAAFVSFFLACFLVIIKEIFLRNQDRFRDIQEAIKKG